MGSDYSSLTDINIPPPPDILAVAAEASDERDPVAVIQEAVNAHHNVMVEIIQSLLAKQVESASTPRESNTSTSKAEDRLLAMQALDHYTVGLKDVRRFDPNVKKGNFTGVVIILTEHHLIQKVGEVSFIIHDRHRIESEHKVNLKDRLQIKYNAGKIYVNTLSRAAAVNSVTTHELVGEEKKTLKNIMDGKQPSNDHGVINTNSDREAE